MRVSGLYVEEVSCWREQPEEEGFWQRRRLRGPRWLSTQTRTNRHYCKPLAASSRRPGLRAANRGDANAASATDVAPRRDSTNAPSTSEGAKEGRKEGEKNTRRKRSSAYGRNGHAAPLHKDTKRPSRRVKVLEKRGSPAPAKGNARTLGSLQTHERTNSEGERMNPARKTKETGEGTHQVAADDVIELGRRTDDTNGEERGAQEEDLDGHHDGRSREGVSSELAGIEHPRAGPEPALRRLPARSSTSPAPRQGLRPPTSQPSPSRATPRSPLFDPRPPLPLCPFLYVPLLSRLPLARDRYNLPAASSVSESPKALLLSSTSSHDDQRRQPIT